MFSELLIQKFDQYALSGESIRQASEQAINLYQRFLDLLLLYPTQPLTPNQMIDSIFHAQIALVQSSQEHLPFAQGLIQHQRCKNSRLIQKNFLETAAKFEQFGSEIAKEFLADAPGACDILYYPNGSYQNKPLIMSEIG